MIIGTAGTGRVAAAVPLQPHVSDNQPLAPDSPLLQPVTAGALPAANRIWMAPLTRNRADADGTPNDLAVEYYRQRAGAGVIISEGSQPAAAGQGYINTAGVVTAANEAGWRRVADAVHADGGRLVVQLMHVGRIAHTDNTGGRTPVSATGTAAAGEMFTAAGMLPFTRPRAGDRGAACRRHRVRRRRPPRRPAGVDGVELHAANGYLLHQFLADGVNDRTDAYGGRPENRARFVVDVARAVSDAVGAGRVGIRISPGHPFNDVAEDDLSVYETLVTQLAELDLAYLHVLAEADDPIVGKLRATWPHTFVLNTGFGVDDDRDEIERIVADGVADAVTVGRPFLANPDLVERWRRGAPLNEANPGTFYGGGAEGYTDYPRLAG